MTRPCCKRISQALWVRYPVWQHTFVSSSAFSRRAVVSYWRKYVHEVLVNRLGGLSLPRKSVVRLTDRPDMTLDVYRGRKTTIQQYNHKNETFRCQKFHGIFTKSTVSRRVCWNLTFLWGSVSADFRQFQVGGEGKKEERYRIDKKS